MPLTGDAKRDYMRAWMRNHRATDPKEIAERQARQERRDAARDARLMRRVRFLVTLPPFRRKGIEAVVMDGIYRTATEDQLEQAFVRYKRLLAAQEDQRKNPPREPPKPVPTCTFCSRKQTKRRPLWGNVFALICRDCAVNCIADIDAEATH